MWASAPTNKWVNPYRFAEDLFRTAAFRRIHRTTDSNFPSGGAAMSASRMKNLILLVLTLCTLGLLCIVVPNRLAQTHEQRQMLQELKTLYEGYDLSIDLDELPRSPTLYIVELSEDGAQTAAQALLGAKTAPAGASGFESTYESDLGTLHITRTGGFSASLTGGSRVRNPEKAAEKLLHAMDFQYQSLTREQAESGAVRICASQTLLGVPVLGSLLELTYMDEHLTAVEGTFYTGGSSITRVSEQEAISAADALAQLLARRDALGWVGSTVTSLTQGYLPSDQAGTGIRFVPVWLVETDAGSFFINGITREITAEK